MNQTIHVHLGDSDLFECEHVDSPEEPEGYPVLSIRSTRSRTDRLDIFPTLEHLRRLRAAIGAYLAERDAPDGSADRVDIVPIPAEAVAALDDYGDLLPGEFPAAATHR